MKSILLKIAVVTAVIIGAVSCSKTTDTTNFSGTIKGLRKGTVYLKKVEDTSLVVIDSVNLNGIDSFSFDVAINEPDVYYLYLDKKDGIQFNDLTELFLEPSENIVVTTQLDQFTKKMVVKGSKNHTRLEAYKKVNGKFNLKRFELINEMSKQVARKNRDSANIIKQQLQRLIKNKYLYTVNFAMSNKEYEVAPYILTKEIKDVQTKYLDTVYQSLVPKVKTSKYGKELEKLILERAGK